MSETVKMFNDEQRDSVLNPEIQTVAIGRKHLREIEIYPLSLADQLAMTEVVVALVQTFFSMEEAADLSFVEMLLNTTKGHFKDILESITEEEDTDALLGDITNRQAEMIGEKIYAMNYEFLKKKIQPWIEKIKSKWAQASVPSLQPVSEATPSTTSPTTTESDTETED